VSNSRPEHLVHEFVNGDPADSSANALDHALS
jgi:hypothetical protein